MITLFVAFFCFSVDPYCQFLDLLWYERIENGNGNGKSVRDNPSTSRKPLETTNAFSTQQENPAITDRLKCVCNFSCFVCFLINIKFGKIANEKTLYQRPNAIGVTQLSTNGHCIVFINEKNIHHPVRY